jgi:hypothetical protein
LPHTFENQSQFFILTFAKTPEVSVRCKGADLDRLPLSLGYVVKFFEQFYIEGQMMNLNLEGIISGNIRISAYSTDECYKGKKVDAELDLKSHQSVAMTMHALLDRLKYLENKNLQNKKICNAQMKKK